jgi:uncharacterized protein (UPF0332 family)
MDKKFEKECMSNEKKVVAFSSSVESNKKIKEHNSNSEYFLESAQNLLKSTTPNVAVLLGFFAMEHKANALVVSKGYDMKNHECTVIFLSRELKQKDLARDLNDAYNLRNSYGYKLDLKRKDEKEVEIFINKKVIPFITKINKELEKT